ncbi:FimV/HubP family polar landmark protein [Oceanospirillum sp.]|uniref:FimV/HubP family polar landmark protein n=1 Tax=Oceanospirillum sp. TaxID=2021254 RepID=UPI003A8D39EB
MVRKLAGTLATVGMLSSPLAFALGLGEAELLSSLNQPFRATIQLAETDDVDAEDIRVQLADERAFAKAGLDRQFFLENLTFSVISGGNGPYIELKSSKPVKEPFLNFLLAVEWPQGQLMREYTFLIDPPTYNNASADNTSAQSSSGVQAVPASSARTASPVASLVEEGAHRIKVGPTDTLWSLARKNRPDSDITIKQAMLGIQDANPDAFPTGNINNMEAGSTILIPNRSAMMSRTGLEAIREVARQNKAWVAFKAQSVPGAAKLKPASTAPADSKPLKLVADTEQQATDSERAKVSEELALSKESLDQSNREKTELSGRLDELQKQVSTLQKLIRLKDEQLAAMEAMLDKQNKLLSGESVAESNTQSTEKDSMAISTEPPVATTASAAVTGQVSAGAIGLDLAAKAKETSEQSDVVTEQDAQSEPVESFSLDTQETTELDPGSFLVDSLRKNATIIGGAAAAILALILLLVVMRRRKAASKKSAKQKNNRDDSDLSDLATGAAAGAAGVAALDAISNDDLPDDLSLDDDLSGDLDESSLSEIEMDLDDLGEPDVQAESSSADIEDLGDFDLGGLGDDLEADGESLELDGDLDLDDLDFSEDFDLGDPDGDDEKGDFQLPFVQAESTVNTELAVEADSGESVQDNLIESDAGHSDISFDDEISEPEVLDDLELDTIAETSEGDPDIQIDLDDEELIDLEGDDLSDLELSEIDDIPDLPLDGGAIDTQEQKDDELLAALADDAAAREAEKLALESEQDLSTDAASDDFAAEPAFSESGDAPDMLSDYEEIDNTVSELSALDEAESYRELGQPERAAAILQRSLGENPEDNDVRLKFMEVLVDLGDEATFDHELRQLQNAADAKALGEALTLQQELYNKTGASHYVAEPSAVDEVDDLDDIMPLDDKAVSSESADADYDVDLNSELDALERDFERYAGEESSDDSLDLDDVDFELMDLDLGDDIEDNKPMINLDPLELGEPEPLGKDDFELTDLADLESDDLTPFSVDESDADYQFNDSQQALRSDAKDYIEDLGDLSMSAVNEPETSEVRGMEELVSQDLASDDIADLSPSIDDDDDLADLGELSDISFEEDSVDEQLNLDGLLDENENPEIKLDLARAYVDMGNTTSAIEALEDVLKRGSTEQKRDASELIAKLQGDA